jgi:hypothetical protein
MITRDLGKRATESLRLVGPEERRSGGLIKRTRPWLSVMSTPSAILSSTADS